jgi:hypothetical protein
MSIVGFTIYLIALLIAPPIAAIRAGFSAAMRMVLFETVMVVGAWLLISVVVALVLGLEWVATYAAGGVAIESLAGLVRSRCCC